MAQHIRQGLSEAHAMLLYRADDLRDAIEEFLLAKCGVKAAQVVGACRRRVSSRSGASAPARHAPGSHAAAAGRRSQPAADAAALRRRTRGSSWATHRQPR